jgi:asparagine synthase (glutamine-hydrolysing)
VVGARPAPAGESLTRDLLKAQRLYGSENTILESIPGARFGISPSPRDSARPAVKNGVMLVADLRLDNRSEVLERVGATTKLSDSELLLAAWLKAGEECLSWIAGDFAVAIFDSRARLLALARDPTGQMPLHYAQRGDDFAFASMPSGLRPFVGGVSIDRLRLAMSVCDLGEEDRRSHFEQIERVLPGEIVRVQASAVRRKIYWNPRTFHDGPRRPSDLVEEYRHILDLSVGDRLKGCNRPIATHLSSGYDSSAVTATAARLVSSPDQVIAFTSAPAVDAPVPPELWRIGDESGIAAKTASAAGVRHVIVRDTPPMRTVIRRQSLLFQEPLVGVPNIAWLLQIRRRAREAGANCLLTGDCGNLSLNAGGLYVLSDWIWRRKWLTWAGQARRAAARPDTHWRGVLFNSFGPWLPNSVSDALRKRYLGAGPADEISFLRPEWRAKALDCATAPDRHPNSYDLRVHLLRTGNPAMLRKGGLAGEGVDERDPLADRRLIEFSLRIPPEQLFWNGASRPLARAALADRLPSSVIDLTVRGLQGADWAARFTPAELNGMLEEISASASARELFDIHRMREAMHRWPSEDWNERAVHRTYRQALLLAFSGGMFAAVHEQGASPDAEKL